MIGQDDGRPRRRLTENEVSNLVEVLQSGIGVFDPLPASSEYVHVASASPRSRNAKPLCSRRSFSQIANFPVNSWIDFDIFARFDLELRGLKPIAFRNHNGPELGLLSESKHISAASMDI